MLKKFFRNLGGDSNKKIIEQYSGVVSEINALESKFESLTDDQLAMQTDVFKQRISDGEALDDLLPEAFAVVRETSKRTIGLRHYDVQLIGGMILRSGSVDGGSPRAGCR